MTRHEWALLPTPQVPTLNSGMTSAALCNANGWKVGTTLAGCDAMGVAQLTITAIGRDNVLVVRELTAGRPPRLRIEHAFMLHNMDWRRVPANG